MAYSDLDVDIVYVGDGVTTTFPINFAFIVEGQVAVELYDITDPDNPVQQAYVLDVDYSISGTDVIAAVAPTTDQKVMVYRRSVPTHETNYSEYSFPYAVVNDDFDAIYQLAQENKRTLERAILNPRFNALSGNGDTLTFQEIVDTVAINLDVAADIANLQSQIDGNDTDIATNAGNISTNAGNISTNTTNIGTNTTNIGTNASDITSLDTRVGNNETDIADLQATSLPITTVDVLTLTGPYAAANNQTIIITVVGAVAVSLPTPTISHKVTVKIDANFAGKTITSGANIDGFGSTFTFTSEYQAVTLISDGVNWFII